MSFEDGRLKVVQIACGNTGDQGWIAHTLYALTEDGRVWCLWKGHWEEEAPIEDKRSQWQRKRRESER